MPSLRPFPDRPWAIRLVRLLAVALLFSASAEGNAHEVGLSRGTYTVDGEVVVVDLVMAQREAASAAPELDADHNGNVSTDELDAGRAALQKNIVDRVRVTADGKPCGGKVAQAKLSEQDGFEVQTRYTCPAPVQQVDVELALLDDLAYGHRHIARVMQGVQVTETVLSRSQRRISLTATPGAPTAKPPSNRLSMLGLGVEHILTGYDHLIFLLGLVLVGGRLRSLLWVVTAFTLAHSITLGLAALGVWSPSPRVIEPLIALSVAYVGVENFFVKNAEKRWRITFPFGLIHGFGFAGALREVAIPKGDVPLALFLFNAGVEVGQLGVLLLVLPLLAFLRKKDWFERWGIRAVSSVIVVAGLTWFFLRVTSAP